MRKQRVLVMICALFAASCSGVATSAPIAMTIPPSPAVVASPTLALASLLTEHDLDTQTGTAYSLDWTPDGETLAVASGVEITLLRDEASAVIAVLKPSSGALTAAWSPDQKRFATVVGLRNPTITLWDWDAASADLTEAQKISAGSDQYGVAWSRDGKRLASLANDRRTIIQVWDTSTGKMLNKFELPYANPRRALVWSADNKTIYEAGELVGQVIYFAVNVESGSVQELGKLPSEQVFAFTIAPDAKEIAVADEGGNVQLFEVSSGNLLSEFQSVNQPVDLAWNPNGMTLAILGYKTTLQLWSVPR